jgi:uncharacterized membrane protein YdjX (TVP38/TMEM64 family)
MLDVLAMMALVFALNLLPAFGPPTWAVLATLRLSTDIPAVPLVLFGALAAACGRFTLAAGTRRLRPRLSPRRVEGLEALRDRLEGDRGRSALGLALFALSPIPSGQLFVAAGLTGVRLVPLTAAFFAGRLVSYTIYVSAASAAQDKLGDALLNALRSPWGIALQILLVAGLVALVRIDWVKVLRGSPQSSRSEGADAH